MIRPHVELSDVKLERRSGSDDPSTIIIVVETISDELQLVSPSLRIEISLPSFLSHCSIRRLIADQLIDRHWLDPKTRRASTKLGFSRSELLHDSCVSHRWLADHLASEIYNARTRQRLGFFGHNGLILSFTAKITPSPSKEEVLTKMVQLGKMSKEDSSKMGTEPCSICLDNLVTRSKRGGHVPTRMTCSHAFHDGCLLVWLQRTNTCPLCRTVLYDIRSMIGKEEELKLGLHQLIQNLGHTYC